MKLRLKKSTALITSGLTVLGLFAVAGIALQAASGQSVQAQAGDGVRLITVHDRGAQSTFVSSKETLREAFAEAKIEVDTFDAVEPSLDEKLVAPDYQVNVYRARPVTVVDGATRQKIITPYQSAKRITEGAGITLHAEDTTVLARSSDLVGEGAGLQLIIDRATPITVELFGKMTNVRTQAGTVGEFLTEKNISLGKDDRVSVAESTPISEGMNFRIWREGRQTITAEEDVAFEVEQIKDADREVGYKSVQTPGEKGKRTVTYDVEIQNGQEVKRTEIASVTTLEPVKQVEIVGSKQPTPSSPTENQAIGREMMLAQGFGEDQWSCLYNLWMRESGWRTTAGNPSSGAYGIPQSLPASKMASFGSDYQTNSRTQIAWGLNYIKGRYKTPCGAWSAFNSRSPHWY